MAVFTRIPVLARGGQSLPDPAQRVVLLRGSLRFHGAGLAMSAIGGSLLGVAAVAATRGYDAGWADADSAAIGHAVVLGFDWRDLSRRMRGAQTLIPFVHLVRPELDRRGTVVVALVFAALAGADELLSDAGLALVFALGFIPRMLILDALVAWREHRDGRRYLSRAELDDHELLHATPDEVRELEAA